MRSPWMSGKRIGCGERLSMGALSTSTIQRKILFSVFYGIFLWVTYGLLRIYVETIGHENMMGQLHDEAGAYLYARYAARMDNVFIFCIIVFIVVLGIIWIPGIIKHFGRGD